ncbi:MAG TPA: class I SAM-dependent methyltransferase [Candidatus Paceibacterota bacterium]|nr:class I SAM-dependent methyltransferase [Candidatus Paceibacterota bacterium]
MNRETIQEDEYEFPYHHIPTHAPFAQSRLLFWGYEYEAYLEEILAVLEGMSFKSLIDIGCGDGRLLSELVKSSNARLVGTDFSEKALAFARAFSASVEFQRDIPDKETFDVLTLIEVLEHIPPEEIPTFLNTLRGALVPGGKGVITVPSVALPVNRKHYQHFSAESLTETLSPYFVIDSITHLNTVSLGSKIIARLLSNRFFILNHSGMREWLYGIYKKHHLRAHPGKGARLMAIVTPRA